MYNFKREKIVFFTIDMIVYVKHPKESIPKKLLELKSEFNKVTGIKVKIQKKIYLHFNFFLANRKRNQKAIHLQSQEKHKPLKNKFKKIYVGVVF